MATDQIVLPGLAPQEVCHRLSCLLGPLDAHGLGFAGTEVGPGAFDVHHFAMFPGRYGAVKGEAHYRAVVEATPQGACVRLDSGSRGALMVWGICIAPVVILGAIILTKVPTQGGAPMLPLLFIMTVMFGGGGGALAVWAGRRTLRTARDALARNLGAV